MQAGSFNKGLATTGLAATLAAFMAFAPAFAEAKPREARILQCVPFARDNSGIQIIGDARTWWNSAAGVYERGSNPEVGAVLNFRANRRSRLGHVAVVTNVISPRMVEIDHANWAPPGTRRGAIRRNMTVVDVSQNNDWSAVRVSLISAADKFGSVYPTYGFIYDRPDRGTLVANGVTAPALALDPAPSDLRLARERARIPGAAPEIEEVAEAPEQTLRPASRLSRPERRSSINLSAINATRIEAGPSLLAEPKFIRLNKAQVSSRD